MPSKPEISVNPNTDEQTYEVTDEDSDTIIQHHCDYSEGENIDENAFD